VKLFENESEMETEFKRWCRKNRWTRAEFQREFARHGEKISHTSVANWMDGTHIPRKPTHRKILQDITRMPIEKIFKEKLAKKARS